MENLLHRAKRLYLNKRPFLNKPEFEKNFLDSLQRLHKFKLNSESEQLGGADVQFVNEWKLTARAKETPFNE